MFDYEKFASENTASILETAAQAVNNKSYFVEIIHINTFQAYY